MSDDETRGEPLYITPEPWSPTHRCIPLARLAALEAAEARAEAAEKDAHEWQRAYAKAAENWECLEEEHGRELAALHDAIAAACGNVGPETPEEAGKRLVARVRELEAKREAAEAQLAALREAAREMDAERRSWKEQVEAAEAQLGRLVAQFSGVLEVVRQARDAFGKVRPHDETAWPEREACTSAWDALAVAAKDEHYRTIAKAHTLSVRAETLGWAAERLRDLGRRGHPEALSAAHLVEEVARDYVGGKEAGR